jgi:hypothetical protein
MQIVLTKDQILSGSKCTEEFAVEKLGGAVKIRALTDGELTKIDAKHLKTLSQAGIGPKDLGGIDITLEQSAVIAESAKELIWSIVALAMSVDGQEWTAEEVSGLDEDLIEAIAARVEEMSRGKRGQVESFRKDDGRAETEKPDTDGVQAE